MPYSRLAKQTGFVSLGSGNYTVGVPDTGLTYLWIKDSDGFCAEPEAVIATGVGDQMVKLVAETLKNILWDNKKGIEAGLRQTYPAATLKQVHDGSIAGINDWPSILVPMPRFRRDYSFMPLGMDVFWECTIQCIILHEDETTQAQMAGDFGNIVAHILTRPGYESFDLSDGTKLQFGMVKGMSVEDTPIAGDGGRMAATAMLSWSAQSIYSNRY